MANYRNKITLIMEKIYLVLKINLAFLIINVLLFQIYFVVDFRFQFLPLYAIASILLFPSITFLYRYCWLHLTQTRFSVKVEVSLLLKLWRIFALLQLLVWGLVMNLYLIPADSAIGSLLTIGQLVILILSGTWFINFTEIYSRNGSCHLKDSILINGLTSLRQLVTGVLLVLMLIMSFNFTYYAMLFIFGLLVVGWASINHRKEGIPVGIPKK